MGPLSTLAVIGLFCLQGSLATGSAENNLSFKLFVPEYFQTGFGYAVSSQTAFVAAINQRTMTWKAGVNPIPSHFYQTGVLSDGSAKHQLPQGVVLKMHEEPLPTSFDARQKWTYCPSMSVVRNQGCCGSSYAVSAVSTMTDRWCVHSEGMEQFNFGAYDVMSCCLTCGLGCNGGLPSAVWQFWVENGITSGGAFGSNDGCQSYPFDVCSAQLSDASDALQCLGICQPGFNSTHLEDKRFGRVAYAVPQDEESIMYELYNFGPVQTSFTVYTDFLQYKSGVYRHTVGLPLGTQSVKVMGWGVENGLKYWLCANSWGAEWGDGGFFKVVRGEDHLGVEANVVAGLPLFR